MKIVTVCSHAPRESYYCYQQFFDSCNRLGMSPLVLKDGFAGLGTKPAMLKRAIESGQIKDNYICFSDAWDVVFQQSPLQAATDKIIFNAERNCFPDQRLTDKFPETKSSFKYLNSGFSIGPTELYLQALKEMKADELPRDIQTTTSTWTHFEDQKPWQLQYLNGKVPIHLDTNCDIAICLHEVRPDELDFSEPLIKCKETGSTPIALHLNGSGKSNGCREPILKHLGL